MEDISRTTIDPLDIFALHVLRTNRIAVGRISNRAARDAIEMLAKAFPEAMALRSDLDCIPDFRKPFALLLLAAYGPEASLDMADPYRGKFDPDTIDGLWRNRIHPAFMAHIWPESAQDR